MAKAGYDTASALTWAEARRQLTQLLRDREPLYQRADLTIDTSKLGVDEAVAAIVAALDPAGPAGQ